MSLLLLLPGNGLPGDGGSLQQQQQQAAPWRRAAARQPRMLIRAGMLPGTVAGPPVVRAQFARARPAAVQSQPRQSLRAGLLPGRGLSGIPPMWWMRDRQAALVPVRAGLNRLTAGARVPPVVVITLRSKPGRSQRQPMMAVRAGMTPGTGLSGIPVQQVTLARRPRLVARGRGIVTGPLAPGATATVTPIRPPVLAAVPRRGPPRGYSRVTTGMLPGRGLSGIPVPLTRSRPAAVQRQPRQSLRPGMTPGLGLSGIPVQQTRMARRLPRRQPGALRTGLLPGAGLSGIPPAGPARSRAARLVPGPRSRVTAPFYVLPPGTYPAVSEPTRFARTGYRLARQPLQRVATGMLPGTGLSGIPPSGFVRSRQVPPAARARSRVAPAAYVPAVAPVVVPVRNRPAPPGTVRSRSRLAAAPVAPYPPLAQVTRLAREPSRIVRQPGQRLTTGQRGSLTTPAPVPRTARPLYRLVRQPAQRLATGMLPGTGLSGLPPTSFLRSRPAAVQRQPRAALATGRVVIAVVTALALRSRAAAQRQPRMALAAGRPVPPPATALVLRSRPAQAQRQPRMALAVMRSVAVPARAPALAQRPAPAQRARAMRLAPGTAAPPVVVAPVRQRPARVQRQMRMALANGTFRPPLTAVSLRSRAAVAQRQPRMSVAAGQRGSLAVPVPVPVTLRSRQRIRAVPQRLVPAVVPGRVPVPVTLSARQRIRPVPSRVWVNHYTPPPVAYPAVAYPARIAREPSRLVRQPRMRVWTGMLPGFTPGFTGRAAWRAQLAPPRWKARPGPARWQAQSAPPRWAAGPAQPRWAAGPALPRWRITMAEFQPIAAASLEEVNVTWSSSLDGTSVDPTGQTTGQSLLPVQMAFPVSSGNAAAPAQAVTWYTAGWLTGGTGFGYVAQCLVGPGGGAATLVAGQSYDVWSRITGTPEVPAKYAGALPVY